MSNTDEVRQENETPASLLAAQESLRDSQRLLRAVFDGALEPMVLTNELGIYVDANPAACALYGLTLEQLVGRSFGDFASLEVFDDTTFPTFRERGSMRGFAIVKGATGLRRLEFTSVSNVAPGLDLSVMRDITESTATEEALRRSEALFRAVIEKSAEVMSLTTADGATRYLTPSAWRLLGWTREELGTRTLRELVIPEDRARLVEALDRLVRTGSRDMSIEFRVQRRDGSIAWIESTGTNLLDDPNVAAIVGNYRDITSRKHAEDALRASRDRLEEAQAIAHVGSWSCGIATDDTIDWTRECCRIFGLAEGTTVSFDSMLALVHADDRDRLRRANHDAVERGLPLDIEHRVERPDGRPCWVHARASIERDHPDGPRMVGTVQDITDHHAALEALRESEERYRRIIESTSESIWVSDANRVTTFVNQRLADMLGYTVDEMIGKPVDMFIANEGRDLAIAMSDRRALTNEETYQNSYRRKNGTVVWALAKTNTLFDVNGVREGAIGLLTDVTEARKLEETRARLAAIVESSEDAILSATLDGTVTSWNRSAEKLYQYSAEEMIGQSTFRIVPPHILDGERRIHERIARGDVVEQYETVRSRKDGSIVSVAITLSPVRDLRGKIVGFSKIARDLTIRRQTETALRRSEEQLRHAQKMEAVGRLAGGIAHDFNNLLSVILSYSSMMADELKPGDPLRCDVVEISNAGNRAAALTRQLLAFSRQQILQPRVISLNVILVEMTSMLRRLLGEDVELTVLTAEDLGYVVADPGQLEQVVMNLAVNARDAMPDGGKLIIETMNVEIDSAYASARQGVSAGNYVMLAMSDTGTGMDAATRGRIFEPFFTTKELGKGTGLGLATVFGIVQQSGGHLGVYSEVGLGTIFKIYLARTDRAADVPTAAVLPMLLRGSETILLVEDDDNVRAVASTILRRSGYHVLETSNGTDALRVSNDFTENIDLLMTDVVMPRMSGRKLAEALTLLRPNTKILFASGYTDDAIVRHGVLDAGVAFLQKPFTPDALLRKIRAVLDTLPTKSG